MLLYALLAEEPSLLQLRPQRHLGLADGDGGVGGVVLSGEGLELGDGVVGHSDPFFFWPDFRTGISPGGCNNTRGMTGTIPRA